MLNVKADSNGSFTLLCYDVAHVLVRAASRLASTPACVVSRLRLDDSETPPSRDGAIWMSVIAPSRKGGVSNGIVNSKAGH